MPARTSPQLRFLLRGSLLVIVMLTAWWLVLLDPLLDGLRLSTSVALHLLPGDGSKAEAIDDPAGNWIVQVPIPGFVERSNAVQKMFNPAQRPVHAPSLTLAVSRDVPVLFSLVFPLFWAAALAAPWSARTWKIIAIGTFLVYLQAVLAIVIYSVYTIDRNIAYTTGAANAVINFCEYINMYVAPYAIPILLALALNADLRTQIFSLDPAAA
jgi:hypothetical protein